MKEAADSADQQKFSTVQYVGFYENLLKTYQAGQERQRSYSLKQRQTHSNT